MGSRNKSWACLFSLLFLLVMRSASQSSPSGTPMPEAVLQVGHRRAVHAIVFSPDGRWLASGAKDDTVKIWEVSTGRLLRTLYGHGNPVNALAVSPDGKLLASGSGNNYDARYAKLFLQGGQVGGQEEDTTVRLWEVSTGRELQALRGHHFAVTALAFTADGRSLTSVSSDSIRVWDVRSFKELRSMQVFPVTKEIGGKVAKSSLFGSGAGRHKRGTTEEEKEKKTFQDLAVEARVSSGGELVATALPRKRFQLYDAMRMQKLRELDLSAGPEAAGSLAFSPDAHFVAYIKDEKEVAMQSAANNKDLWHSPIAASGSSISVWFTADGKTVVTESVNARKRVLERWSATQGNSLGQIALDDDKASRAVSFSADGKLLAMAPQGSHSIDLRDTATAKPVRVFGTAKADQASAATQDPTLHKQLVDLGLTQSGEFIEAEEDAGDFSARYHISDAITFTLDGKFLLSKRSGRQDVSAVIWDTSTGTAVQDLTPAQFKDVGNPDRSPDGHFAITPQYEGDIKGFSKAFVPFTASQKDIDPLEQRIKVADAHSGRNLYTLDAGRTDKAGRIPAAGFSLDSSRIAVSGYKNKYGSPFGTGLGTVEPELFVFDTGTGNKLTEFSNPEDPDRGPVDALALSRDSHVMAAGYRNKSLELLDAASGKSLASIPHLGGATALTFNPDGRLIALLGKDGDAYLFDAHGGQLLATLVSDGQGDWLVVTPDGKFDGSPGGWNQILWRFGGDTFNVAPVETFFNEFYYPGLLADIIAGKKLRETRDFAQLDRRQPSLEIATVGSAAENVSTRTVPVQLRVAQAQADNEHSAGSGIRDVRLFRNGSLVKAWRGDLPLDSNGQAVLEATIPIVASANRLTAYAFNHDNIKSADASLVVTGSAALKRTGTAYVVSVGIDQYTNPDYTLKFAVADAQDVSDALAAQQRKVGAVGKVEVVPLLNADATKANILLALRRLAGTESGELPMGAPTTLQKLQPAQPEDEVFIYFAGHGAATGQRFYIVPHDLGYTGSRAQLDQAGFQIIAEHSISDLELETALDKVDARDVLLVIDACNSGQALEAEERRRGPMNSKGLAQLAYEKGMYVLTAAQGYQAALEVKELGHGLLTYALVEEGLKTAAADRSPKDGKVVAREWMDYATMRVPELQEAQIEAAQKQGRAITFAESEEDARGYAVNRALQRPRVFYRREADPEPLVVAKP